MAAPPALARPVVDVKVAVGDVRPPEEQEHHHELDRRSICLVSVAFSVEYWVY
jgi:hypothetical protein